MFSSRSAAALGTLFRCVTKSVCGKEEAQTYAIFVKTALENGVQHVQLMLAWIKNVSILRCCENYI
jgi:hypothetical protein